MLRFGWQNQTLHVTFGMVESHTLRFVSGSRIAQLTLRSGLESPTLRCVWRGRIKHFTLHLGGWNSKLHVMFRRRITHFVLSLGKNHTLCFKLGEESHTLF